MTPTFVDVAIGDLDRSCRGDRRYCRYVYPLSSLLFAFLGLSASCTRVFSLRALVPSFVGVSDSFIHQSVSQILISASLELVL